MQTTENLSSGTELSLMAAPSSAAGLDLKYRRFVLEFQNQNSDINFRMNDFMYGFLQPIKNQYYNEAFDLFPNSYNLPHVIRHNDEWVIISNRHEVQAAMATGKDNIVAIEVIGLPIDYIPQFTNYKEFFLNKNYVSLFDVAEFLINHWTNNEVGKNWYKRIDGDMNNSLSTVLMMSKTKIADTLQIGRTSKYFLEQIDAEKMTFIESLEKIGRNKSKKHNHKKHNQPFPIYKKPDSIMPDDYVVAEDKPEEDEDASGDLEQSPVQDEPEAKPDITKQDENVPEEQPIIIDSIEIDTAQFGDFHFARENYTGKDCYTLTSSDRPDVVIDDLESKIIDTVNKESHCLKITSANGKGFIGITINNIDAFFEA